MLNFTEIDNSTPDATGFTVYQRLRFDMVSALEGVIPTAYLDSKNSGIPSIGIGFNLRDDTILGLVLSKFNVPLNQRGQLRNYFELN